MDPWSLTAINRHWEGVPRRAVWLQLYGRPGELVPVSHVGGRESSFQNIPLLSMRSTRKDLSSSGASAEPCAASSRSAQPSATGCDDKAGGHIAKKLALGRRALPDSDFAIPANSPPLPPRGNAGKYLSDRFELPAGTRNGRSIALKSPNIVK